MDKNYPSQVEVERLLESSCEQMYRKPTAEEFEQILHNLTILRSLNMKEERTEIVEELNILISYIDEMDIRVEDKGEKKHVSISCKVDKENFKLHDSFFLTLF